MRRQTRSGETGDAAPGACPSSTSRSRAARNSFGDAELVPDALPLVGQPQVGGLCLLRHAPTVHAHDAGTRRSRQVRLPDDENWQGPSSPPRCRTCPGCASPRRSTPSGRTLSASARPDRPPHDAGTRRSRQVRLPDDENWQGPSSPPRCRTCPGCASPSSVNPKWADFVCFGTPRPPTPRRRYAPEQTSSAPG